MEKGKRLLSFMLAIIMMLGILPSNLIKVNATGENDYGVVGAYKAYSYNEKLYEKHGDKEGAANEVIYIKKNNDNDLSTKGMPAYCFNASLSMVDVYGKLDDVPDFSNLTDPMPTYTKINGSVGTTFVDLAAHERIQDNNELSKAVLKVIYNGYRENDGNRVEEIKKAYKKKYNEDISDAEVYAATQKAIWYYTDSVDEFKLGDKRIGTQITTKVLRVYRFLIGKDDHGLDLKLNDYTGGKTLDLYMPDRGPQDNKLAYQNLLGTEIVDKNETTVKKHDITVKKVDEDGRSKLARATLQLKSGDNVIYRWITKDDSDFSNATNNTSNPRVFHLQAGKYELSEIAAPEGYKKADPIKFTVDADGKVDGKTEIVMKNTKIPVMSVEVSKTWKDENDSLISEGDKEFLTVKVKLKADGQDAKDASGNEVAPILLKKSAWTGEFKNLPIYHPGKENQPNEKINYTVEELGIPDEFKRVAGQNDTVTGDNNGDTKSIALVNKKTKTPDKPEVKSEARVNRIQVNKKWSVPGKKSNKDVYFELWKEVEGKQSKVTKEDLPEGMNITNPQKLVNGQSVTWQRLYVKQEFLNKNFKFLVKEVDSQGKAWEDEEHGYPANDTVYDGAVQPNGMAKLFEVTNTYKEPTPKPEAKEIIISKTKLGGEEVEGAEIEIYNADGKTIATDKITGKDAKWTSEKAEKHLKLEVGEYIFKEVAAPEGLQKITELKFEVKADGKVEVLSKGTNEDKTEAKVETNGNKLTVEDKAKEEDKPVVPGPGPEPKEETTTVKFSKQDIEGRELTGARIVLAGDNGYRNEWTSNGRTEEFTLKEGKYTFREISTPDNSKYEFATEITFEVVKDNGKLKIQNVIVGTGNRELADGTLVMVDDYKRNDNPYVPVYPRPSEPNRDAEVRFSKQNLAGKELAGAQIELIRDGRVIDSWKTTGVDRTFNLSEGTYVFRETIVPEGYKISTDITFTVTRNGEIINVGATGKNYVAGSLVVMVDDYKDSEIPTEPTKPNTEDPTKPTEPTKPNTEDPKKEDKPIIEDAKQEKDGDNSDDNGVVADNNDNGFDDNYNNAKHLPKTGDGVNPIVYAGAMVLAGAALGILGFRKLRISRK